jgi:hypothetical protein
MNLVTIIAVIVFLTAYERSKSARNKLFVLMTFFFVSSFLALIDSMVNLAGMFVGLGYLTWVLQDLVDMLIEELRKETKC